MNFPSVGRRKTKLMLYTSAGMMHNDSFNDFVQALLGRESACLPARGLDYSQQGYKTSTNNYIPRKYFFVVQCSSLTVLS